MKKHLIRSLLCFAMLWMPPLAQVAKIASCAEAHLSTSDISVLPCGAGEVSGIIKAADTGLPLPNVVVTAFGYSYSTTSTDANGHYAFQYQTANGPTPISLNVAKTGRYIGAATSLFNVVSGTVTTMDFMLAVGASITGFVHATDVISPLQSVSVALSATTFLTGASAFQSYVSTKTDANGYYQILGIAPGSYKLRFGKDPYAFAYFGGAGDEASATVITSTTPNTITANMLLSPGARITGNVFAADSGASLTDFWAYLVSADKSGAGFFAHRYIGDPSFIIQGLRPGSYKLTVYPLGPSGSDAQNYLGQYYDNQISSTLANLITITQVTQTVGISVSLQRGGVITGVVRDANTTQPVAGVGINLTSDDPRPPGLNSNFQATTDASGIYTATGLPSGHYQVGFYYQQGYPPFYYSQVYDGRDVISSTITGTAVTVTAPLTVTNINFSLHPILTGTITGRVTDPAGLGIKFVYLRINRTDSPSGYGVEAYTDINGYYTATVNTASYFVEFTRNTTAFCDGCYNDQFYAQPGQSTPKAVTVTVGSMVSGINATLKCDKASPKYNIYVPLIFK